MVTNAGRACARGLVGGPYSRRTQLGSTDIRGRLVKVSLILKISPGSFPAASIQSPVVSSKSVPMVSFSCVHELYDHGVAISVLTRAIGAFGMGTPTFRVFRTLSLPPPLELS